MAFRLSLEAIEQLENILKQNQENFGPGKRSVHRYLLTDKYLQKTGDYSEGTRKGEAVNRAGDKSKIRNIEIPITFMQKDTVHAYLVGVFLTGSPIFAATASRQHEDTAGMLTALVQRDQHRLGWVGELSECLDDSLGYNICAAEVLWTAKRASNATTTVEEGVTKTGKFAPIVYEGNNIKRIDPYNLIKDDSVPPHKVHSEGAYVGYIERMNYIQLKRAYMDWDDSYTIKKNIKPAFEGTAVPGIGALYYDAEVSKDPSSSDGTDWGTFWGTNAKIIPTNPKGVYEKVVLYQRLVPKEYKVDVPNAGEPQVYKLIWINGHLVYVEPIQSGHEYLPIVVGQIYKGKHKNKKSFVEYLTDLQDLGTSLMTAGLDSMRRAVGDRAIYNPSMIRKADIESPSPVSKIPLITNSYNADVRTAYHQVPYNDNISPNVQGYIATVLQLSQDTTGANKSAQGSFVKGNKTMHEFETVMSNSQARLQLGALNLENSFFAPMKEIIKLNYLVFSESEEIDNGMDGTTVEIDPAMLREYAPEFKMADGIMPATKIANTEVMMQAMQILPMNPMTNMEYDVGGIILSLLKQQGFHELPKYKRTPEQQQQYMAMMGLMQQPQGQQPTAEGAQQ